MPKKGTNQIHVVPDPNGGWNTKPAGKKATDHQPTQSEAEKSAKKQIVKIGGGEVVIHRPNGQIKDSDTVAPGKDPCPPKDKK